MTKQGTWG